MRSLGRNIIGCAVRGTVSRTARDDFTTFTALAFLYFASGAVGLLDEVIFFKYLSLAFGATAHASSAVLVAFMGGARARGDGRGALRRARVATAARVRGAGARRRRALRGVAVAFRGPSPTSTRRWRRGRPRLPHSSSCARAWPLPSCCCRRSRWGRRCRSSRASPARHGGVGARRVATLYGANTAGGAVGALLGAYASSRRWGWRRACARGPW